MKLNKSKCQIAVNELVFFLGYKISSDGKADPKKVHALKNLPQPINKTELQKFFEMLNRLGKFVPSLSIGSVNLIKFLGKDNEFIFETPQIDAFNRLKQVVEHTQTLKIFYKNLPVKTTCDASKLGLDSMLEQVHGTAWHLTAFASRSLTVAKQNYSQIEEETLSIVFSCEKFYEFV